MNLEDGETGMMALTPRHNDVLRRMAYGMTNREIGEALGLSQHTVAAHAREIYFRINVQSRTQECVRWWEEQR